jgi:dTDP-glucose 4,6-dehydratase
MTTEPKPIVVVTGAYGFLGLHVCRRLAAEGVEIVPLDRMSYAAINEDEVRGLDAVSVTVDGDVADPATWSDLLHRALAGPLRPFAGDVRKPVAVIHLAAETHVDRSLGRVPTTLAAADGDALDRFWRANAIGTARVARWCAENSVRMVHLSTDEVLGDRWFGESFSGGGIVQGRVLEADTSSPAVPPGSPYAASKVAAEAAVFAEVRCSNLDAVIVRPSNLYGPGQARDKLIPVAVRKLVSNENVPLYGDGLHVREWVHVEDVARLVVDLAVSPAGWRSISLLPSSQFCGVLHAGGGKSNRIDNRHLVYRLAERCVERGLRPACDDFCTAVADRPGHDRAYALDSSGTPNWTALRSVLDQHSLDELIDAYGGAG